MLFFSTETPFQQLKNKSTMFSFQVTGKLTRLVYDLALAPCLNSSHPRHRSRGSQRSKKESLIFGVFPRQCLLIPVMAERWSCASNSWAVQGDANWCPGTVQKMRIGELPCFGFCFQRAAS